MSDPNKIYKVTEQELQALLNNVAELPLKAGITIYKILELIVENNKDVIESSEDTENGD